MKHPFVRKGGRRFPPQGGGGERHFRDPERRPPRRDRHEGAFPGDRTRPEPPSDTREAWKKPRHVWRKPAEQRAPVSGRTPGEDDRLAAVAASRTGLGGFARFGDIPAHRLGKALRSRLYQLANGLPAEEHLNLVQRLKHAATTVTAALATGFGEGTFRAGVNRALESRGALMGVQDHLEQLLEQNLLQPAPYEQIRHEVDAVVQAVNQFMGVMVKERAGVEGPGSHG